jgi:PAS domain S-box-containing protein
MPDARILIVEDKGIRTLDLKRRLTALGYPAPVAALPGQARRKVAETRPDLVLRGLPLPGSIDGAAAAEGIPTLLEPPVVYISSGAEAEAPPPAGALDPYGYLAGPFTDGDLRFTVDMALHRSRREMGLRRSGEKRQGDGKAILRAKREWERTFDAIPDLIAILDRGHRIVRVNRAMADRLALAPDRCIGVLCHEAIHGNAGPPAFCPHAMTCRDGRGHVAEVHEEVLGGDFLVSTTPLHDDQGRVIGSIHVARDITERKRMEDELREKSNHLEEANRELESFSYSVSHDLRAPLRGIDGYARMLFRDAGDRLDEDSKRKLLMIREQAGIMGRLIDDLLAFARFGRAALSPSRLDIEALTRQVWEELCRINPDRRMELRTGSLPAVLADLTLMRQVLANLLSNAVKFTRGREAVIEVAGSRQGNEIHYQVRDNGAGFDMQYVDKLFGVFQRLHSEADFEGTGVGLAIVQRIVHRHGGRVWAEGEPGKGATFHFTVPDRQARDRAGS